MMAEYRRVLLIGLVGLLALGVVAGAVARQMAADQALPPCGAGPGAWRTPGGPEQKRERWSQRAGAFRPGATVVEVAADAAEVWRYRAVETRPDESAVTTGFARPGAVDESVVWWSANGEPLSARTVMVGDQIWEDSPEASSWAYCRSGGQPYASRYVDSCFPTCKMGGEALIIGPGSRVPVRNATPTPSPDGQAFTTYEVTGVEEPEFDADEARLRAAITLDQERRLRGARVWDRDTGTISFTLEVGPAPDHPTIGDPSAEPRFTPQAVPPKPVVGTVPTTSVGG